MADPLADYDMLEELGSGSFGVVYKALEKATNELVAIKHIDLDGTDDDIRDIQQEISLLSTCSSQYVTRYKTSFVRGVKLWIVMEYLGGGSCLDLLKMVPFSESHVAVVCRELLLGLDYLHASGKIHRDIKAANILLSNAGRVKIADFGVAAQLTNIKSQRNTFVGTPFWMAPEVIQESGYDFKADIWSLGITTMELIQGEPPNADLHPMKALFHIPKNPPPRLSNAHHSREIRSFVACCLVKDPEKRPSARDLLQHRFIQRAGSMNSLRDLIRQSQQMQYSEDNDRQSRYYEETLRDMSRPTSEPDDDWVFDTVKPKTMKQPILTMKKRKLSQTSVTTIEPPVEMMQSLRLDQTTQPIETDERPQRRRSPSPQAHTTMMRVPRRRESPSATTRKVPSPSKHLPSSPSKHSPSKSSAAFEIAQSPTRQPSVIASPNRSPSKPVSTARRVSTKQPLALDMSFGNTPSNTRPFRRVSDESPILYTSPHQIVNDENLQPHQAFPVQDASPTKESKLGHRIFSKAIDPAFQEVYAHTSGRAQQEALAKAGEAWAMLDSTDPEGTLALFRLMLDKVRGDPKLSRALLPIQPPAVLPQLDRSQSEILPSLASMDDTSMLRSEPESPQKPKLVLAQNNPHLKSLKRRQSSQVSLISVVAEKERMQFPGQARPGMEHTKATEASLYDRWLEGLKGRWPQV